MNGILNYILFSYLTKIHQCPLNYFNLGLQTSVINRITMELLEILNRTIQLFYLFCTYMSLIINTVLALFYSVSLEVFKGDYCLVQLSLSFLIKVKLLSFSVICSTILVFSVDLAIVPVTRFYCVWQILKVNRLFFSSW